MMRRRYFKMSKARAREIVHEVERVVAGWREEGHRIGMTNAALEPFVSAFEHAGRDAARRV